MQEHTEVCFFFTFWERRKQGWRWEEELSANHRPEGRTHPFGLKILLVNDFDGQFSARGSLEGQLDFSAHASVKHTAPPAVSVGTQQVTSQRCARVRVRGRDLRADLPSHHIFLQELLRQTGLVVGHQVDENKH